VTLCWLLYRQAVRLNIGVFFSRTAIALIVIAAGVLAHGLGDLQEAGLLPGQRWVAFDLTAHVDPSSWWISLISGATELAPRMTVLQVVAPAVGRGRGAGAGPGAGGGRGDRGAAVGQRRDDHGGDGDQHPVRAGLGLRPRGHPDVHDGQQVGPAR
jgi:Iron permease FTR1 family